MPAARYGSIPPLEYCTRLGRRVKSKGVRGIFPEDIFQDIIKICLRQDKPSKEDASKAPWERDIK